MKSTWFRWPIKSVLLKMGGIPVPRKGGGSLTEEIIRQFESHENMCVAVTPEGTRSRTTRWRTGFLHIAIGARVPIMLAAIDYRRKIIQIEDEFIPSGDIEKDMRTVKNFYKNFTGKHPQNFTTDD